MTNLKKTQIPYVVSWRGQKGRGACLRRRQRREELAIAGSRKPKRGSSFIQRKRGKYRKRKGRYLRRTKRRVSDRLPGSMKLNALLHTVESKIRETEKKLDDLCLSPVEKVQPLRSRSPSPIPIVEPEPCCGPNMAIKAESYITTMGGVTCVQCGKKYARKMFRTGELLDVGTGGIREERIPLERVGGLVRPMTGSDINKLTEPGQEDFWTKKLAQIDEYISTLSDGGDRMYWRHQFISGNGDTNPNVADFVRRFDEWWRRSLGGQL